MAQSIKDNPLYKEKNVVLQRELNQLTTELTDIQKAFIQEGTVSTTLTIDKWLKLTKKVAKYDEYTDILAEKKKGKAILFTFLTFLPIIVAKLLSWWVLVPILLFGFLAIRSWITIHRLNKDDLNNYLRKFFVPIVEAFRGKAGGDQRLSATLDFRHPTKGREFSSDVHRGRNRKLYEPNPVMLSTQFRDGVTIDLVLQDNISNYHYRNARGKPKTKQKMLHQYLIKLTAPISSYPNLGGITDERIAISQAEDRHVLKFKGKMKRMIPFGSEVNLSADEILRTLQLMYAILQGKDHVNLREEQEDFDYDAIDDYMYMGMWYGYEDDRFYNYGYNDGYHRQYRSHDRYVDYDREDYQQGFIDQEAGFGAEGDSVFDS